jgi:hypothetical protein
MMTAETKKCIGCCETKLRSEFWSACKGTALLVSRCKNCHVIQRRKYGYNRKPREKKLRVFDALSDDMKSGILEMMNGEGKVKKKEVATKFRIPYSTFCQWCQKGWVK